MNRWLMTSDISPKQQRDQKDRFFNNQKNPSVSLKNLLGKEKPVINESKNSNNQQ